MITVWIDKDVNRIKLQTDDSSVRYLLEGTRIERKYNPWKKGMDDMKTVEKIYDERRVVMHNGIYTFTLGLGWSAYIANVFKGYISTEEYNSLISTIVADTYRNIPFSELRDYQNEDILHLLKYKIGLLGCYTSYGGNKYATLCKLLHSEKSDKNGED